MPTIRVTTVHDITRTDVRTRRHDNGPSDSESIKRRNQQSNFETVLQLIGLRGQPEEITDPEKQMSVIAWTEIVTKTKIPSWTFQFNVSSPDLYATEGDELGALKSDCDGIPMITGLEEYNSLSSLLDTTSKCRNIHFEVINDNQNN